MPPEANSDLEALERFVAENDDLQELEEKIGRFNVFDALGIARAEIRHSNFLAWLLDPNESHGQGDLFLKAVLMDMLRRARERHLPAPLSPVHLDGAELRGVEIRREHRNIDLLILCRDPCFVIAVENKVGSGEHSNQLHRYEDAVALEYAGRPSLFVFLSPSGEDATDEDWLAYSYADLHRVLTRVRRQAASSLGGDVAVFLDHYLNLIGSRFMDDPEIQQLCRRIYANHRRAIDLVVEHAGSDSRFVLESLSEAISQNPIGLRTTKIKSGWLNAVPPEWEEILPPIGTDKNNNPWEWVTLTVEHYDDSTHLVLYVGPTSDEAVRARVLHSLCSKLESDGVRHRPAKGKSWRRLWVRPLATADSEDAQDLVQRSVDAIASHRQFIARITDALRAGMQAAP